MMLPRFKMLVQFLWIFVCCWYVMEKGLHMVKAEPRASVRSDKAPPPKKTIPETGQPVKGLEPFDRLMRSFVRLHQIPGAALAVVKDGRLVYARGFGYADIGRKQPVQPDSLFRIASISKPITAVTVLRLVERGKLSLDDRVLDILKYRPHLAKGKKPDPRWRQITVRHLLQHTGGWDRDASFDPMFRAVEIARALKVSPPAKPEQVIRYMRGQPLDFDPGTKYAYSNFGYCLLGRIIEKKTGQKYARFVQSDVLQPIGITRMKIGRTLFENRAKGEVRYYTRGNQTGPSVFPPHVGQRVPWPYGGWYLEAMDSHGGWIASAVDLCRFAAAVDRPKKSRLLTRRSIRQMFAPPPAPVSRDPSGKLQTVYYGLGWSVRQVGPGKINTWHTGSLAGTSTILVRRHDGLDWAVLFNTRDVPGGHHPAQMIDPLLHFAAALVKKWPTHDLFGQFR